MRMAMRLRNLASKWGVTVRSWNGRPGGVRHIQVGGESGEAGAPIATTEEVGKGSGMLQHEKACSSSPQDQNSEECRVTVSNEDKPQPSPRFVKQNAERVKASMNTKNI